MEILRSIRNYYGITQTQLARYLGLSQGSIARIETGDLRPSIETKAKIQFAIQQIIIMGGISMSTEDYETIDQLKEKLEMCGSREKAIEIVKASNSFARVGLLVRYAHKLRESKIVDGQMRFTDDWHPEKWSAGQIVKQLEKTNVLEY